MVTQNTKSGSPSGSGGQSGQGGQDGQGSQDGQDNQQKKTIGEKFLSLKKERTQTDSTQSTSTGSGGGGGGVSRSPPQDEPVVVRTDQFGNPILESGITRTIRQERTVASKQAGVSFVGTPGSKAVQKFPGQGTITEEIGSGFRTIKVERESPKSKEPLQSFEVSAQSKVDEFERLRETPFGEAQRAPLSQIKSERAQVKAQREQERIRKEQELQQTRFFQAAERPFGEAQKLTVSQAKFVQEQRKLGREAERGEPEFFSAEGQKRAIRRVTGTFEDIGTRAIEGGRQISRLQFPTELFKGADVAPQFRETFIGDVAGFISSPASIVTQPILATKGAPLVLRSVFASNIAAFGARRGLEAGERSIRFTQKERDILQEYGTAPVEAGFQSSERSIRQIGEFNREVIQIEQEREIFENQVRAQAQQQGLNQAQTDALIKKEIKNTFNPAILNFYRGKGFSDSEARRLQQLAIKGQAIEGAPTLDIAGRSVNLRSIANEVSIFFGDEKAYKKGVREFLSKRGLRGKELDAAVNAYAKDRNTRARGELAGLLAIEVGGELTGGGIFRQQLLKLGKRAKTLPLKGAGARLGFTGGFKATAPAGIIEGASGVAFQQQTRFREQDFGDIALGGGFGGVSAGLLGGFTIGTKLRRPLLSKTLEGVGFIADPFELPGDFIANLGRKGIKRVAKSADIKVRPQPRVRIKGVSPTVVFGAEPTTVLTQTAQPTPSAVPVSARGGARTPATVPTGTPTQTTTQTPIPTDTISAIIGTPADVPAPTQVSTPVDVPIPISIPTPTPIVRVPPPLLPFAGPITTGRGRVGAGKQIRKTINELEAGFAFFQGQLSGNPPRRKQPKKKTKKTKKKKRRK